MNKAFFVTAKVLLTVLEVLWLLAVMFFVLNWCVGMSPVDEALNFDLQLWRQATGNNAFFLAINALTVFYLRKRNKTLCLIHFFLGEICALNVVFLVVKLIVK